MSTDNTHSPDISRFNPQAWLTISEAVMLEECDIGEEGLKKACQRKKLGEKRGGRWWVEKQELLKYLKKRKRGRPLAYLD